MIGDFDRIGFELSAPITDSALLGFCSSKAIANGTDL